MLVYRDVDDYVVAMMPVGGVALNSLRLETSENHSLIVGVGPPTPIC